MLAVFHNASNAGGIYRIRNIVNQKVYIGSTRNFKKRCYQHHQALKHNSHSNIHLQNAFNHYGASAFLFEVIEVACENGPSLVEMEQFYLDKLWDHCRECYNLNKLAKNTTRRKSSTKRKLTLEHKIKISLANKGKKLSNEHKQKIRDNAKSNPNYGCKGKPCSESTRKKISESRTGEKHWFFGKRFENDKNKKHYDVILVSPQGEEVYGFFGLHKFAKENEMSVAGLKFLITGKRPTHKGWKCIKTISTS